MRRTGLSLVTLSLAAACGGGPARDPAKLAGDQAALATDTAQARLWREAGASGAAAGVGSVYADRGLVTARAPVRVAERAAQGAERPFPADLEAAVVVLALPEAEGVFTGSGRVQAVSAGGEVVTLDLGGGRTLRAQIKVGGGPLRARAGDSARVYLRTSGDPMARNDVLALRLAEDEVVYALVGSSGPVAFRLPAPPLAAAQVGEATRGTMPVAVTVGGERRTLKPGETAGFAAAGLTVKVLASTAIQGEAAHAVEGDRHRIELLAWRSRRQ